MHLVVVRLHQYPLKHPFGWHVGFVPQALHGAVVLGAALEHVAAGLPELELLELGGDVPASAVEAGAAPAAGVAVAPAGALAGSAISGAGAGSVGACDVLSPPESVVVPTAHATRTSECLLAI